MSSPEISTVNAVRWRVAIADRRWHEALELVRQASAQAGYSGPDVQAVERIAAAIAELRAQVKNWSLDEQVRRASRPRIASRGLERSIKKAIAEAAAR
jgi:hypothetical protein